MLPRFASVAAGEHFSCALTRTGDLYTWGCESNGQLGRKQSVCPSEPRAIPRSVFTHEAVSMVACGWRHTLACTASGKLFAWGSGAAGQLGRGGRKDSASPSIIEALSREKVERIAAGRAHSLCTTSSGLSFAWGDNTNGQCGLVEGPRTASSALRPQCLLTLLDNSPIVDLSAGASHSMFVSSSGHLFACGDGAYGQLCAPPELLTAGTHLAGTGDGILVQEPCLVPLGQRVLGVSCGAYHTVLLMRSEALRDPTPPSTPSGAQQEDVGVAARVRSQLDQVAGSSSATQGTKGEEVEKEEEEESGYDELEPLSTLHLTPVGKDGGGEKKDWPVDVDDPLS